MATRIKNGEIPYTGGIGIEITKNHVINVLLRKLNNLIHVNDNRELYVDLQLPAGIEPDDDFPVGVTTGEILQEDGWPQSGTIINWKTTSGDYTRIIYANDGKLYYDPGTGQWIQFTTGGDYPGVATSLLLGLIKLGSDTKQTEPAQNPTNTLGRTYPVQLNADNQAVVNVPWEDTNTEYESLPEENGGTDESLCTTGEKYIWNHKQDKLTPGTRIIIDQNNVISADISGVLTYKGNVTDPAQLPQSGNTVGDCWFSESNNIMYAWDGTQWNAVGSIAPDLSNYFNKVIDDSDDITQGTTNLFVSPAEKSRWNNKQDKIRAGRNITIDADGVTINATDTDTIYTAGDGISIDPNDHNKISNTLPFNPGNQGSVGQFLKRTSNGYQWANIPGGGGGGTEYEAGDGIDITNDVISNTKPFDPTNEATSGYVLKASGRNTYYWGPESGGGGGGNFNPQHPGTAGQVLTKGSGNTYDWKTLELPSGNNNVKFWTINSNSGMYDRAITQQIYEWLQASPNNGAIIDDTATNDVFVFNKFDNYNNAVFHGTKRKSEAREWTVQGVSHGYYTKQWQWELDIYPAQQNYGVIVRENPDDDTHTNYISALPIGYLGAFTPTEPYQPATKDYVDRVAAGTVSVNAITNNISGTIYRLTQEWVGTQAQYDALDNNNQIQNGVIYNIISSS